VGVAYADDGDFLDVLRFRHCISNNVDIRAVVLRCGTEI
jgi:hypothetical protein